MIVVGGNTSHFNGDEGGHGNDHSGGGGDSGGSCGNDLCLN